MPALEFDFACVVSAEADEAIETGDEVPWGSAGGVGAHEGGGAEVTDEDDLALFGGGAAEAEMGESGEGEVGEGVGGGGGAAVLGAVEGEIGGAGGLEEVRGTVDAGSGGEFG